MYIYLLAINFASVLFSAYAWINGGGAMSAFWCGSSVVMTLWMVESYMKERLESLNG